MERDAAVRAARVAGVVTAVAGPLLLVAPRRAGELTGVGDQRLLRWIAWSDIALAPGLLAGRRRSAWLTARAATNVAVAVGLARQPSPRARGAAAALAILSVVDGRAATRLRRPE